MYIYIYVFIHLVVNTRIHIRVCVCVCVFTSSCLCLFIYGVTKMTYRVKPRGSASLGKASLDHVKILMENLHLPGGLRRYFLTSMGGGEGGHEAS